MLSPNVPIQDLIKIMDRYSMITHCLLQLGGNKTWREKYIKSLLNSTLGKAFAGIGRQMQTTFLIPLSNRALPLMQQFSDWFEDKIPVIQGFFSKTDGAISGVAGRIGGQLQPAFEKAFSGDFKGAGFDIAMLLGISDSDAGSIMDTIGSVFDDLKGINDGLISSLKPLAPIFKSTFGSIGSVFQQLLPIGYKVGATLYKVGTNIIKGVMPAVQYINSQLWPIFSKVYGFIANDIVPSVSRAFNAILPTIISVSSKFGGLLSAMFERAKP